ncbi:MAG: SH3 domain-containing protein [Actinobacteria bacterium]|nr:SH3 domain-containing protein [Actinomycetota bacterium]
MQRGDPATTGPPSSSWAPTHRVGAPLEARAVPDPAASPSATLAAGTEVRLTESRGDWGRVDASNGWWGWVDARRLEAIAAPLDPGLRQTLVGAAEACVRALDEHAAGRLDEAGLRQALLEAATVRWGDALWILELETGRWWRFDGTSMVALEGPGAPGGRAPGA